MRRNNDDRDRQIVNDMWTLANNEPLTLATLQPFGLVDRERYRRYVDGVILELTLDCDARSRIWSYDFAVLDPEGGQVDDEVIQHWLRAFFGTDANLASKRSYLLTHEARFVFPHRRS